MADESKRGELMRKYAPNLLANPDRARVQRLEDLASEHINRAVANGSMTISSTAGTTAGLGTYTLSTTAPGLTYTSNTSSTSNATPDLGKAVVAEVSGRTMIAAPAKVEKAIREPTITEIADNPVLKMSGRFVGGEQPNRNGALWSAGDLELANATVAHGPLNWLHEERHIIGSLTSAAYLSAETAQQQTAGAISQPHIRADASIWTWIWPDEAYVVEQFSELGQLWYSMECISREVVCAGETGCGNTTTYDQYLAGATCDHVKERATTRQFKDPVFLGGAVIVPPTKPGWADAHASVMAKADKFAEAAYDQAGQPDIGSATWTRMMAQLVRYADEAPAPRSR